MECRINAEDPDNDFAPSPGRIASYNIPGGRGVRVDSCAYQNYTILPFYDSLLAKLIAYGKTRSEAIQIMLRALEEYIIEPIKTTAPFCRDILNDARFLKGKVYTDFVDILISAGDHSGFHKVQHSPLNHLGMDAKVVSVQEIGTHGF